MLVTVAPGKTLGGLLFASYESGSTLEYRELNVVAGLVRAGGRVAFYLTRLYVDSGAALAGGRAIWGVPKVAASFDVTTSGGERSIVVSALGGEVCRMRARPPRIRARLRTPLSIPLPALGTQADRFLFFTGRLSARFAMLRSTVELPHSSEFAALSLDRPWLSVSLDALELAVPAPTTVARRASTPNR